MLEALLQLIAEKLRGTGAVPDTPDPASARPPYRPELTERLRHSHSLLLQNMRRIVHAYARHQHDACLAYLRELDFELRAYLLGENAEFAAFLSVRLAALPERLQQVRQLRARLRRLAHEAHEIGYGRGDTPFVDGATDYALAFANMERTLQECLETHERDLFDLYHPPMRPMHAGLDALRARR